MTVLQIPQAHHANTTSVPSCPWCVPRLGDTVEAFLARSRCSVRLRRCEARSAQLLKVLSAATRLDPATGVALGGGALGGGWAWMVTAMAVGDRGDSWMFMVGT